MDECPKHERFMQLFLPVQPGLHSYLRTLISNRTDAEDILQAAAAVMPLVPVPICHAAHFDFCGVKFTRSASRDNWLAASGWRLTRIRQPYTGGSSAQNQRGSPADLE
jgi:hypothetical protein